MPMINNMDGSGKNSSASGAEGFFRMLCFLVFSGVGMSAIALSLLAQPWAQYYAHQDLIIAQERRLAELQQLHEQQAELLANAEQPAVVERAAIDHLNYVPAGVRLETTGELPPEWPDLQTALAAIDQPSTKPESDRRQQFIVNLSEKTSHQIILLLLGSALVILSLSCFYRQPVD
jgi:hypothetical protein